MNIFSDCVKSIQALPQEKLFSLDKVEAISRGGGQIFGFCFASFIPNKIINPFFFFLIKNLFSI